MVPASLQSRSNISQPKDFTRVLPFQLSMAILGLLDQKSLDACSAVSGHWEFLVRRVREDKECRSAVQKNLLQLQELCPRKTMPNYAKRVDVQIPQLNDEGEVIEVKDKEQKKRRKLKTEDFSLHEAYRELKTQKIKLEERNVFCGPYKTCVLMEQCDRSRRAHFGGGDWVAAASRRLRLFRVPGGKQEPLLLHGHAGPVRALCLREDKGLLLSCSSLELSIRCWNIHSGACVRTFTGHYASITCLHSHQEHFVSGAGDGMVKAVWSLKSGKCLRTLMHSSPVWAVRMDGTHVVSGGHRGLVKVWSAETGALIKTLERHQGPVLCLSFDQWHLVTGSSDGYALGWSMLGKFRRCLIAFFHPKEVLSLEFLYLRVISGCADGCIRIFNFLTGTCLKVLEPTSSGDPVSALYAAGNRVVTNSPSRLLLLQFEDVVWDYSLPADREELKKDKRSRKGKRQGASAERQRARDKSLRSHQGQKSCGRPKSDEAEQGPASRAPEETEATLECELPQRDPSCPMSPDKFLLTISTLQSFCKPAAVSPSPSLLSAKARAARQQRPGEVPVSKMPLQHKEEQAAQLQRARLHSHSLTMTKISTPFETKMLRLRLKNSLHSPTVKSSIPAPCVVRPKCGGSLGERKTPSGHGKDTPGPKDGDQLIDLCTASSELIQPTPGTAAELRNEAPRRIKPFCPYTPRRDSGFRLMTAEQEVCEAAAAVQHQAQQAKPTEDEERARRKAWLRKIKGLPVDSFTGERKTPAPELGHNTFI
ncbi:F-box/WD repeat-containing protein 10-like isoform X1 [Vidua chalybeata]|uniref:F-box/WD repeat-containing protein 10-like isoform X1 n=1 Tax=Vidua chalybeata TaxID=81927 RepID=UPI0023A7E96D|nr:F-box/WD repeat-containing protein 10-like isoform X1 [Vidua chalybeata]XP_053816648.1 F-box/WD repeat-containing protein 10-like isoform X1 [Vidua chalybeata]